LAPEDRQFFSNFCGSPQENRSSLARHFHSVPKRPTMFSGKKHRDHRSLSNNIDSKILNYVREFTQVQLDSPNPSKTLGVTQLYNLCQERDGQLRRLKKVQLEASIQRALNILQSEIVIDSGDGETFDSDFEGIEDLNLVEVKVGPSSTWTYDRIQMR
jgi:hypothetical protein